LLRRPIVRMMPVVVRDRLGDFFLGKLCLARDVQDVFGNVHRGLVFVHGIPPMALQEDSSGIIERVADELLFPGGKLVLLSVYQVSGAARSSALTAG
jgi:hypothetical protein